MKLIGSTSSPYVRKVRVVMAEKKLDYQFVPENVWAAQTSIGESNPLGKVPIAAVHDGREPLSTDLGQQQNATPSILSRPHAEQ